MKRFIFEIPQGTLHTVCLQNARQVMIIIILVLSLCALLFKRIVLTDSLQQHDML